MARCFATQGIFSSREGQGLEFSAVTDFTHAGGIFKNDKFKFSYHSNQITT